MGKSESTQPWRSESVVT